MRATVIAGCFWTPVLTCVLLTATPVKAIEAGINIDVHQDLNILPAPNGFRLVGRLESGPPVGAPGGGGWSQPPVLLDHVDGGAPGGVFPNFTVAISPDLLDPAQNWFTFQCNWATSTGATVPYCNVRHLGVLFDVTCHNVVIDVTGAWTLNGQPLGFGLNQGFVPVPGFRVTDMAANQSIHLRNGDADGAISPGEIEMRITQMDLFAAASRAELVDLLGPEPFRELRTGGAQAALPWTPVLADGLPISPANPWYFAPDSFFDVFLEMPAGPLTPQIPMAIPPGGFLLARERIEFTNNAGIVESRWVWEYHEAHQADLGDAPDSTNSWGVGMTTYPWAVVAHFPTVYRLGSPPYGPIHWQPTASAWLGPQVTFEDEADLPPDQDGLTNLEPPLNAADRDGADDGVIGMPLTLPHCQPATFKFMVTAGPAPVVMYLNAWFDWNRDGDWDDVLDCAGQPAPEWAVQNLPIVGLVPNTTTAYTTPPFIPWNPAADPLWMRVTLAEQPWQPSGGLGYGGAGLPAGYNFGETEDHLFQPGFEELEGCCLPNGTCQDLLVPDCLQMMGTPQGQLCTGLIQACCLPDGSCRGVDPLCCDDLGGVPGFAQHCLGDLNGNQIDDACEQQTDEGCCLPDGSCVNLPPFDCMMQMGTPQGQYCTGLVQSCCLPDGSCRDVDPLCCDDLGGVPGFAQHCLGDLNGNQIDDACEQQTDDGCCLPDGRCLNLPPADCVLMQGIPQGQYCIGTMEACCLPDMSCVMVDPLCCDDMGGTLVGAGATCTSLDACCLPDHTCVMADPQCCQLAGGVAQGPGTNCSPLQACCLPDHTCMDLDPLCCTELGGSPQGDGVLCGGAAVATIACCLPDGTCADVHPLCCDDMGGVPGHAATCLGDLNQNGIDDACEEPVDGCCLLDGTCLNLPPAQCQLQMGTTQGQLCTGSVEACCLPDMSCTMVDPLCCDDMGGIALGAGTVCSQPEACCTPDASTCLMADPLCCLAAQGIPQGAGSVCTAPQACCLPNGACADVDPLCCDDLGGVPGYAANCLGDLNANGIDDACEIPTVLYPKWQQPPHEPGHGFDAPSALWLHDQSPAPLPEVNTVVADDFISDGRPIRSLRWWGSYFDERYLPDAGQDPFHRLDGWLISFHHAMPQANPQCPPDFLAGDPPPTALAVYFAPANAVESLPTGWFDCHGDPVYEHRIDLRNCCLVCFEPDPRNGLIPATPLAFNEVHGFAYWLDIQAVTGAVWIPLSFEGCELVYTGHLPSDLRADGAFWGWHTSRQHRLQEACAGRIVPPIPTPYPTCWNYGGWMKQPWLCPPPMEPVNMAFELWTPVKRGDCTLDGIVGLADHAVLGSCLTGPIAAALAPGCECIDLDVDNDVDLRDFALFTQIFTGP